MIALKLKRHAECRVEEENWAGLSDAVKRRKLQNRLNQRAFRRRKAEQWRAEQTSRGGSEDTASASATSTQQPVRSEGSGQGQDASLFVDSGRRDTFDLTGGGGLPITVQSCPWLSSASDLWEPVIREEEQYSFNPASPDCNAAIAQGQACFEKPKEFMKQCRSQEMVTPSEDISSSLWMCDENSLDLWLQSMAVPWYDIENCGPDC